MVADSRKISQRRRVANLERYIHGIDVYCSHERTRTDSLEAVLDGLAGSLFLRLFSSELRDYATQRKDQKAAFEASQAVEDKARAVETEKVAQRAQEAVIA